MSSNKRDPVKMNLLFQVQQLTGENIELEAKNSKLEAENKLLREKIESRIEP